MTEQLRKNTKECEEFSFGKVAWIKKQKLDISTKP